MDAEIRVIEALGGALRGRKDVRVAMLFGSRARGRARPGSDADVAVEGSDLHPLEAELIEKGSSRRPREPVLESELFR